MSDRPLLVRDLGEHGLLERLQRYCPANLVGDDGAVLATAPGKSIVITTDVLVDRVHFSDRTTSGFDVGWRATAANLSDLAAMGASPLGITVGLSLPGEMPVDWVEAVYTGIETCLQQHSASLVGGDICRSTVASLAITALGEVSPNRVIRRHNAQPGNAIVVTGLHGLSRGGLELLLNPSRGINLAQQERERLIAAHQRPQPRLDILPYLAKIPDSIAIAGMDSSDGLADALQQICRCSNVGARIAQASLTIFSGLIELTGEELAREWMFYGGEDFELVLCLPPEFAVELVKELGENAAIIGEITQNLAIQCVDADYSIPRKTFNLGKKNPGRGFRHF